MKTPHSSTKAPKSACDHARGWVELGLGAAAGGTLIWSCTRSPFSWESSVMLLSLCLVLLGKASPLMMLLDRLPKFAPGSASAKRRNDSSRTKSVSDSGLRG